MFGIEDTYVWLGYLLCIASTVLCVIYGLITWNRGDKAVDQEDIQWAAEEEKVEEEIS